MAKTRLDFAAAYKANKENNAVTEAKIAEGKAIAEAANAKKAQKTVQAAEGSADTAVAVPGNAKEKKAANKKTVAKLEPKQSEKAAPVKRRAGRPASKTIEEGEETSLRSFLLTTRQISAIDLACAKDKSLSKTDVVRIALDEYFEKNGIYKAVELLGL